MRDPKIERVDPNDAGSKHVYRATLDDGTQVTLAYVNGMIVPWGGCDEKKLLTFRQWEEISTMIRRRAKEKEA